MLPTFPHAFFIMCICAFVWHLSNLSALCFIFLPSFHDWLFKERLLGVPEGAMEEFCLALDEELKVKCLSWTGKGEQARS